MIVLDTNVLIYYAAGDKAVADLINLHKNEIFYIPTIVVVEILSCPLISSEAVTAFNQFLSQTILLHLDLSIAERAAEVRKQYRLALGDAVIAASALTTDSPLVTRNIRDFKKVRGLRVVRS